HRQRWASSTTVVHQHHLHRAGRLREPLRQRRQQPGQLGPTQRRHHHTDSTGGHQTGSYAFDRCTANGPSASRSTGAEPNNSIAYRGVSTIGLPAVFSEVFTTAGRPVRRSNSRSSSANNGSWASETVCTRALPSTCTTAGIRF